MSKLQRLDVSDNKLTSAEVVFEAVRSSRKSIEEIHAQGNQIDSLGSVNYTFDNLLILNLSRNRYFIAKEKKRFLLSINLRQFLFFFISIEVMDAFAGMRSLVALDLSHNKLSTIDDNVFKTLVHLQVLNLAHNQIAHLKPLALTSLKRLHVLILSHNNLDDKGLASEALKDLSDLRTLNLDHNRLKSLPR